MSSILACSLLRDMVQHPNWKEIGSPIELFKLQAEAMKEAVKPRGYSLRFSLFENDSVDATPEILADWVKKQNDGSVLVSAKLGEKRFRSFPATNTGERIESLARYRNRLLDAYDGEDWVLFFESDILYHPATLSYLLQGSEGHIRSPLSFHRMHDLTSFYDPLSTRDKAGTKFRWAWPPAPTEEDMFNIIRGIPFEVSSTWNCFCLVAGSVIQHGVRFFVAGEGESEASSFCRSARGKGFVIYLYPSIRFSTVHPLASHPWNENT